MINVIFMGRKPVAAEALKWLCLYDSVDVVAVVTDSHLSTSPTSDIANEFSIPIMSREELECKVESGDIKVDLGLSVLYWQKIRKPLLNACKLGVINFHPAPLPEYKGTAGYNLAILEGLDEWAVTSHYVDENIDTGGIIDVKYFGIDRDFETAKTLEAKSQPQLFEQFKAVTENVIEKRGVLPTSPNVGGRYTTRAQMEEMKRVEEGDDVERKIRAFWFPPYDGAYMVINGVKCTLVHRPILDSLADPNNSSLFTPAAGK